MSFNPLVDLGSLNRLLQAVSWVNYPDLNVTPSFLGREGIRLGFEGEVTRFLPQTTGTVQSQEPYQQVTISINLLKTQSLAALYEAQRQTNANLGVGTAYPDSTTLPPYTVFNCGIANVRELSFSGEDAGYMVTIGGYIVLNQDLWT